MHKSHFVAVWLTRCTSVAHARRNRILMPSNIHGILCVRLAFGVPYVRLCECASVFMLFVCVCDCDDNIFIRARCRAHTQPLRVFTCNPQRPSRSQSDKSIIFHSRLADSDLLCGLDLTRSHSLLLAPPRWWRFPRAATAPGAWTQTRASAPHEIAIQMMQLNSGNLSRKRALVRTHAFPVERKCDWGEASARSQGVAVRRTQAENCRSECMAGRNVSYANCLTVRASRGAASESQQNNYLLARNYNR